MQKKFLKWLFFVVLTAFLLTFGTSYFIQTNQSEKVGVDLIKLKIQDVKHQLDINDKNLLTIKQVTYATALVKAKTLAWIVYKNPQIINNFAELKEVSKLIDVDEIHISNSKGILIASLPVIYKGFDMNSTNQTKPFMKALEDKNFAFVQDPTPRGANGELFQYAGVARLGTSGLVQIGYTPKRLQNAQQLADIKNISDGFRIGKEGSIIVIKNNEIISSGINYSDMDKKVEENFIKKSKNYDESFKFKLDKTSYICLSQAYGKYTIVGVLPESEMYLSRNSVVGVLLFVNLILFVIIFILVSILLQRVVVKGIYKVNNSLSKITKGDLDEKVNVQNVEEFKMLSDGINTTVDALKNAIDKEAKRLDDELELAKNIQHSALPNIFPPYPEHKEFDIYATMYTAKEVGGDFYDFFFIDPNHFAFLIADVSGKGIPAALFMMTSKTLIKNLAKTGLSPQHLITKVNKQLCKNNEQGLFVTLFLGVLELSTGNLTCVNAGHNPPLIKRANGNSEYFKSYINLVAGVMDDVEYKSCETHLDKGDTILLYTDGITEANDEEMQLYGEKRLHECLKNSDKTAPKEILDTVNNDVKKFSEGTQQADDMTMLAVKYNGFETLEESKASSIKLLAKAESFVNLVSWLENLCTQANIPQASKTKLQIAVEEIFVNIASYAYPPKDGDVNISFTINNGNQVEMEFVDRGTKYNPLETKEPDITLSAEERPIGGLGIFIVKKSMDYVHYEYVDGKNIFTIKMNF